MQDTFYTVENLKWLIDVGADEAIGNTPINRFETSAKTTAIDLQAPKKRTIANISPVHTTKSPPLSNSIHTANNAKDNSQLGTKKAIEKALSLLENVSTLEDVIQKIESFDGCPSLKDTATNTIVYLGSKTPDILCIGHTPNKQDDRQGTPFSGDSMELLKRMFRAIDITIDTIGFSNITFWSPPGGRSLTHSEIDTCHPFVEAIISITKPKIIVTLGGQCTNSIGKTKGSINTLHGKKMYYVLNNTQYTIVPTYHPDYILQTPACKRIVWQDLLHIKTLLQSTQL